MGENSPLNIISKFSYFGGSWDCSGRSGKSYKQCKKFRNKARVRCRQKTLHVPSMHSKHEQKIQVPPGSRARVAGRPGRGKRASQPGLLCSTHSGPLSRGCQHHPSTAAPRVEPESPATSCKQLQEDLHLSHSTCHRSRKFWECWGFSSHRITEC